MFSSARELLMNASEKQYDILAKYSLAQMKQMDAFIALRGSHNITETADVPAKNMALAMKKMRSVQNYRVNETRWCVLRWPHPAMAQQAGMSTESFENFFFEVCLLNYKKLLPAMKKLEALMSKTNKVLIKGNGTNLEFMEMYGIGQKETNDFGQYCLKARKLSEAGVRYVQINYTDNTNNPAWDQHSNMPTLHF